MRILFNSFFFFFLLANEHDMRLQSKESRRNWEKDFSSTVIGPVIAVSAVFIRARFLAIAFLLVIFHCPCFHYPSFKSRITLGDRSFPCAIPNLDNVLQFDIRSTKSVSIFKTKLKLHLVVSIFSIYFFNIALLSF